MNQKIIVCTINIRKVTNVRESHERPLYSSHFSPCNDRVIKLSPKRQGSIQMIRWGKTSWQRFCRNFTNKEYMDWCPSTTYLYNYVNIFCITLMKMDLQPPNVFLLKNLPNLNYSENIRSLLLIVTVEIN